MWPISTQQLLEANGRPTVQAHRDAIHKRIRDVKEELRVLDNCLNSIASVNRLPVEVLSMVFAAHASLVAEDYRPWDRESLAAVRVGHVCQRWRNVALDCAEIWARPLFHNLELAKYAVKKSQSHDTVLRSVGYQGTNRSADVLPLYFEAITPISRLQSLEIDQGEVGRDLLSTLVGPAPLLEKVSLSFFDSPQDWEVLPNNLLQGGAPLLKQFSIKNMWIPAMEKLPLAAGLTHLHLETKSDLQDRYETPSSKVFFGVLRNFPLLKSLHLSDYLPRDWDSDSIKPDISLPNLEDLFLEDGAEEMYTFFNPVKIPRAETVSLNIIHAPAIGDDDLLPLEGALEGLLEAWGKRTKWGKQKKTKFKGLQEFSAAINFMEVTKFKFKFDSVSDEDPPHLTVSLPGVSRALGGRYLSSISNLMPTSSLTCLRARGELSAEQWRPFSHIGSLRRITIKNARTQLQQPGSLLRWKKLQLKMPQQTARGPNRL
ncbi:hypothetical protein D9611_004962 [Ephemerocybe angulata]|uniref:F-box domain-containing protein n=1 Tax=Ephemerocybe angulata TaxID=980116 RepID=A0A8H5B3M9_9AGAR|nr:hypothetical protein D9611_004962 [Tulosesus angulatus]